MNHDVLKFHVSVNNQDFHHVIEAFNELLHDFVDDRGWDIVILECHYFSQITPIAVFHENVVSWVRFNCFSYFDSVFALNGVLVFNFTDNEPLPSFAKILPLDNFTSVQFGVICNIQLWFLEVFE